MSKEYIVITDGTYSFSETGETNKFYFYRNDGEVLKHIKKDVPLAFFSRYILYKAEEGEIPGAYAGEVSFERNEDGKCILMSVSNNLAGRPNLRIVKSNEELPEATVEQPKSSFFKRWFEKGSDK